MRQLCFINNVAATPRAENWHPFAAKLIQTPDAKDRVQMRKQLFAVAVATGIAQIAGFTKLWVTARLFGVGPDLDGYNLALIAPTFLSGVVSGMVQTGLFPVRARLAARSDAETVACFERSVLAGLLLGGLALTAVLLVLGPWLRPLIAPGASLMVLEALHFVWPYAVLLVALNAVGDALGYLLAMRDRYTYAAAAPIANAILGTVILVAWPKGALLSLALSTVLGLALQIFLCLAVLRRSGFQFFGPLSGKESTHSAWKDLARFAALILPGTLFSNLIISMPPAMLARFGEGAVSAFGYAYRFHSSAVQLLIMAGSPVILARFSDLAARRDDEAIVRLLGKAARLSFLIGCGAVAAVALLGATALEAIFGGRFDSAAAQRVGSHWIWLTVGLAPALLGNVYAKLWQAQGRPGQLSLLSLASLLIFLVAGVVLTWPLHEFGIAAALALSSFAIAICFWGLGRHAPHAQRAALNWAPNKVKGNGQ